MDPDVVAADKQHLERLKGNLEYSINRWIAAYWHANLAVMDEEDTRIDDLTREIASFVTTTTAIAQRTVIA